MPAYIYHAGAQASCPHGGQVSVSSSRRVLVSGQPVATVADPAAVAGCTFQVPAPAGSKPQPCVRVRWAQGAIRVTVDGQPVLLQSSTGTCASVEEIPQGPPAIALTQTRVSAT